MWYWIAMIVLAVGSFLMLAVSFAGIKKRNDMAVNVKGRSRRHEDEEDDYGAPQTRKGNASSASGTPPQEKEEAVEDLIGRYRQLG